ncbi:MAG: hypothetical protein K2X27_04840 [Candidatus Obscuribacterales bacterium]|nr:hypothetical protein [Candidatus Obscuribacterales bacterium]
MGDSRKTETDKTARTTADKPADLSPQGTFEDQKRDSDAQRAAAGGKGSSGLPELSITGDKEKEGSDKSTPVKEAPKAADSWSTADLKQAIQYLERIKISGARTVGSTAGDRAQENTYRTLSDSILPTLKREGKISADWEIFPSQAQSPGDKVGADFLLVNTKTGAFHFLDATANPNKENVFRLRADGVILVDNALFDQFGSLKVDNPDMTGIRATDLRDDMLRQIESLTKSKTPFRLGTDGTPMPSFSNKATDEQGKAQIQRLTEWANAQAKSSGNPGDFRDMADKVGRAYTHIDRAAREVKSPKMAESIREASEREIARFVYAKYKDEPYKAVDSKANNNPMRILKDGKMLMDGEGGVIHDGGKLPEHVEEARKNLVSEKALLSRLTNKELAAMGADTSSFEGLSGADRTNAIEKAVRTQPKFRSEVSKLMSVFMDNRAIIENGGAVGEGRPVIAESIIAKLKGQTKEGLLKEGPKATDKPATAASTETKTETETASKSPSLTENLENKLAKSAEQLSVYLDNAKVDPASPSKDVRDAIEILIEGQNTRRAANPADKELWPKAELDHLVKLNDAYKDSAHPQHTEAVRELNAILNKKADAAEAKAVKEADLALAQLKGNPTFENLNNETRIADTVKTLNDRIMGKIPAQNKGEFMANQYREAFRKQLGAATIADLPDSIKYLKIDFVQGMGTEVKVTANGTIEIPSTMMKFHPKKVIADVYAHVSGQSMLHILNQGENSHLTARSIKPIVDRISTKAVEIIEARNKGAAAKPAAISSDAAASERKVELAKDSATVTAWDGENLTFGSEKFHIKAELEKLNRERETKIKGLEEELRVVKSKQKPTDADLSNMKELETRIAVEKQNARVASDLHQALSGNRGTAAQAKASELVKAAADKAIADHLGKKGGSGGSLSRSAAVGMVLSTLATMYFASAKPAMADTYEGSYSK